MKKLTKEEKRLLKKLQDAYVVCSECGDKFGVYSVGCSSIWMDKCDVCEQKKPVTEARDYAYLITGIRKLCMEPTKSPTVAPA
jgi:hypothetical protein